MAIFSSAQTAQAISAPPVPFVTDTLISIVFSGTDCRSVTVTLENTISYKVGADNYMTTIRKIYSVNSATPEKINVEVQVGIFKNTPPTQSLTSLFDLDVDPHLREGGPKGNKLNGRFFRGASAQAETELETYYEVYKIPIRGTAKVSYATYSVQPNAIGPEKHIVSFATLVEFKKGATNWSHITLGTLLSDLVENCPAFFLQLCIVGNHKIPDNKRNTVLDKEGHEFKFLPTGHIPAGGPGTAEEQARNLQAWWDQFLLARAKSMKEFIFGTRELDIRTIPAIQIIPNPSGPGETVVWNELADLFQKPDRSPDIARLKQLKLQKGDFAAGSTFLWMSLNLLDTEVRFQPDKWIIYPTDGPEWEAVSANNLEKINKLRQVLAFLIPGASNNFTTNLTDVMLLVEGHTDRELSDIHNQVLSERRAKAVIDELENPHKPLPGETSLPPGIDPAKFNPPHGIGYGETRPRIPTPDGKPEALNRRVLIRVVAVVCTS